MPRKYVRKSTRRCWNEDAMIAAIHEVQEGQINMSCNSIAAKYDIPEATLRRYIKKLSRGEDIPIHGGRFRDTLNEQQSKSLVEYVEEFDKRGFGLTAINLRKLAFQFVEQNGVPHRFNSNTRMAGKDWAYAFMTKHKLSLRTLEATSLGRLMGFNRVAVSKFFDNLKEIREKHKIPPHRIYNMDETGVSTVPNKLPKVVTSKGIRRVAKIVVSERGKITTVACTMSATGVFIPPSFIFGRIRMKEELLYGSPPGSDGTTQKNGWMSAEGFLKYSKHFTKYCSPKPEEPVLLIVDNHSSHISLDGINFCRQHGIVMLGLPPHTSHKLQPLDVGFFGPFKNYMAQACDNFVVNNPGKAFGDHNIARIFCQAYLKAATVGTAVKAFQTCGIEPFDPFIFNDSDFAPAEMSNRPQEGTDDNPTNVLTNNDLDDFNNEVVSQTTHISSSDSSDDDMPLSILRNRTNIQGRPSTPTKTSEDASQPGCTYTVSPYDIAPLPKVEGSNKSKKRKVTSSILTSSPVKLQLEDKLKRSKESSTRKTNSATKKQTLRANLENVESGVIVCPGCEEPYEEPPVEDWIRCSACLNWWHEACTSYEGKDVFLCDLC